MRKDAFLHSRPIFDAGLEDGDKCSSNSLIKVHRSLPTFNHIILSQKALLSSIPRDCQCFIGIRVFFITGNIQICLDLEKKRLWHRLDGGTKLLQKIKIRSTYSHESCHRDFNTSMMASNNFCVTKN
jgi:hypothetical protein